MSTTWPVTSPTCGSGTTSASGRCWWRCPRRVTCSVCRAPPPPRRAQLPRPVSACSCPPSAALLVPTIADFGPRSGSALDTGTRVDWKAYDADPMPRHRLEALEPSQLERHLRLELIEATEALERVGGRPFAGEAARELADAALGGRWGLPDGLPPRAQRVIALAGTIGQVVDVALDGPDDALDTGTSQSRRSLLLRLQRTADRALADAVNAACAVLAGWRPA